MTTQQYVRRDVTRRMELGGGRRHTIQPGHALEASNCLWRWEGRKVVLAAPDVFDELGLDLKVSAGLDESLAEHAVGNDVCKYAE